MLRQAKKGLFLATALLIYLNGNAQETKGIKFENGKSWEQLKAEAKQEHKYIFLDVYATWCGPCKKMDQDVYTNDDLGSYVNANFISAKVQVDSTAKDDEAVKSNYVFAKKISTDYKVSSLPSFLFFDSDGNLIHRNEGAYFVEKFRQICETAADPSKNDRAILDDYYKGNLKGSDLLKLAKQLKHYNENALALEVAKKYRSTVLDQKKPMQVLNQEMVEMFTSFPDVYNAKDTLIRYIFEHQNEADQLMVSPGYSQKVIDYYVRKAMVFPRIQDQNGKPVSKTPSWNTIEESMSKDWDVKIAKRNIVIGKIWYYATKKDYPNWIKYEIEQIELNGVPSAEDGWGAMGVNNVVFSIIFKYSNDPIALKKAAGFMKILTENYPADHAKMDTYASVLYKSGQKSKAIDIERKALKLAELAKDEASMGLYLEVIKKMEKGEATWND